MSDPGIALVMTLLNEEKDLPSLIESIDRQTRAPDEIVVCETGSGDGTLRILREWRQARPELVKIIERRGLNIAEGRNQAVIASVSPIICVTDGGCVLENDWLEQIVRPLLSDSRAGIVYGNTVAVGLTRVGRQFARLYGMKAGDGDSNVSAHSSRSVAFRRQVWEAAGGYPEWMTLAGEDTEFFRQVECFAAPLDAPGARVYWHHGEETLPAVFKRHRRNSEGDCEANLLPGRYLSLIGAYAATAAAIVVAFFRLSMLPPALLLAAVLCFRHTPQALKAGAGSIDALVVLPAITLSRDLGMIAGYLTGLRKKRAKGPWKTTVKT